MKYIGIIIFGIIGSLILVVALVDIFPADFVVEIKDVPVRYMGTITFLADGKAGSCFLNEPNMNIDDDFEECLRENYAGKRITKAKDWLNRDYQQVEINGETYRSFNETKLNDISLANGN